MGRPPTEGTENARTVLDRMINLTDLKVEILTEMYRRYRALYLQRKAISCQDLTGEVLRGLMPPSARGSDALKLHINFMTKIIMEPDFVDGGEIKLLIKDRAMRGPSSFLVMALEYLEDTLDVERSSHMTALLEIRRDIYRTMLLQVNKDIMEAKIQKNDRVSHNDFPSLPQQQESATVEGGQPKNSASREILATTPYKAYAETTRESIPATGPSTRIGSLMKPGGALGGGDDGRRLPVMPPRWTVSDPCFLTLLKAYGIEILERNLMDTVMSVSFLVLAMADDGSIAPCHHRPERTHRSIVECVGFVAEKGIFGPKFDSMSKTRIRGVVGMLKASEVVVTASAGDDTSPCLLALDPRVENMLQVRKTVDKFLVGFVKEHRGQPLSSVEKERLTWLMLPEGCNMLAEGVLARATGVVKAFLATYKEPAIHTIQSSTLSHSLSQPQSQPWTGQVAESTPTPGPTARPPGSYGELIPPPCDDIMPSPTLLFVDTSIKNVRGSQEHSPMTTDEGAISPQDMLGLFSHQEALPPPASSEYSTPSSMDGAAYSLWGQGTQTSLEKGQQDQYNAAAFGDELIQALSRDSAGAVNPMDPYPAQDRPPGL